MSKFVLHFRITVVLLFSAVILTFASNEANAITNNTVENMEMNKGINQSLIVDVFIDEGFVGDTTRIIKNTPSLTEQFHDSISSLIITQVKNNTGGYMVELCEHISYAGQCLILGPGKYDVNSIDSLNDKIDSVRFLSPSTLKVKGLQ